MYKPAVIGLNGPPHSGKTFLVSYLERVIPDAVTLRPSDELFAIMIEEGIVPRGTSYQDYKKNSFTRERLIAKSAELREKDPNVFSRRVTELAEYCRARVVIIDNLGFYDEVNWFDEAASVMLLLRLETPYNEIEPMKSRARRTMNTWMGDSRRPLEYSNMLTAYDSLQMTLLLDWLRGPLTPQEVGPYHGIKQLWDRYFAPGGNTKVRTRRRSSGELGRLGQTVDGQSSDS